MIKIIFLRRVDSLDLWK